jgi:hypothetical protein
MFLAAILEACLLLAGRCANFVPSAHAAVLLPITQQPGSPQSNSSSQNSSDQPSTSQPSTNQQKTADQSTSSSQSSAATTAPCPQSSPSGSRPKSDCKPTKSTAAKTRKHHPTPKPVVPAGTPDAGSTPKTVVKNGGTDDSPVALSPGVSPQQASRETDSTNKLLAASDANLEKASGRQLSANQQDTVKQIKSYMKQAKDAEDEGDVQRAYNLAVKANLLSAELAGQ